MNGKRRRHREDKGKGQLAERGGIEEQSVSLTKVGTRLKERGGSYGNVEEMLIRKREEKGGMEEREWKEIFSRSKKEVRKREKGKGRGKDFEEVEKGLR